MESKHDKVRKAVDFHNSGYNCSQSVLMAFAAEAGISEDLAARCGAGLGGGVGALGEICGVVTGMGIAEGLMGNGSNDSKKRAVPIVNRLGRTFGTKAGCIRCRDLKGKCGFSCDELIRMGVEILYDDLNSDGQ